MDKKIAKNASWIIVCRLAQAILNLIVSMITARYLGPSNFGLITYAGSIVAFIIPLVQLGISGILVQEFVDHPSNEGRIIGTSTVLSSLSSVLGIVGIWLFTCVINAGESVTITVSVLYGISMIFQSTEMIQYWYQSKLMSKYVSVISLISRTIVSLYKVYIIVAGKSIYWFAVVNSLDFFIISILLFVLYFKLGGSKLSFSFNLAKDLLSRSKHFIIAGMMVSVFSQTDKIMLKLMINDAESGFYSAAITCAGMTVFLFTAIIDSFRPVIFEKKKTSESAYKTNMVRLFSIIIYLAFAQSLVLAIFATPIVNLLYGSNYSDTIGVLRIITWYSAFSYLGSAKNIWFLAESKQNYIWIINFIGAIINIIGNFMLIPEFGACGAAIASLLTQIITNFVVCWFIKPLRENVMWMVEAMNPRVVLRLFV